MPSEDTIELVITKHNSTSLDTVMDYTQSIWKMYKLSAIKKLQIRLHH